METQYIQIYGDEGVKRTYGEALTREERIQFHADVKENREASIEADTGMVITGMLVEIDDFTAEEYGKAYERFSQLSIMQYDTDDDFYVIPADDVDAYDKYA